MKIAIFGGAFNPVHLGHIEIVKQLNLKYDFDKILIVPTKISPHKSNDEFVSETHRFNMCSLAFENIENCEVSKIELDKDSISYTYQTLEILRTTYPNDEFYLICGSDMYLSLLDWKNPNIIFDNAKIIGFIRDNENLDTMIEYQEILKSRGADSSICKVYIPPYSSTQVRLAIKSGIDTIAFLNSNVKKYIENNKLYL